MDTNNNSTTASQASTPGDVQPETTTTSTPPAAPTAMGGGTVTAKDCFVTAAPRSIAPANQIRRARSKASGKRAPRPYDLVHNAYRAAGHLVVGNHYGINADFLAYVSTGPNDFRMRAIAAQFKLGRKAGYDKDFLLMGMMVTLAAGVAAQKRRFPHQSFDGLWDRFGTTDWFAMKGVVSVYCFLFNKFPICAQDWMFTASDKEARRLVDILWPDIQDVAEAMIERQTQPPTTRIPNWFGKVPTK